MIRVLRKRHREKFKNIIKTSPKNKPLFRASLFFALKQVKR